MRTDDLIAALGADAASVRLIAPRVLVWGGTGLLLSAGVALSLLGIRSDLTSALGDPVTLMKWVLPILLAVAGMRAGLRLSQPQRAQLPALWIAGAVAAFGGALLAMAWFGTAPGQRWTEMRGNSLFVCLPSITLIALLPLGAILYCLRDGATTRPGLSGAMAGLAAGGVAAATYAFHCNEDAPLFFVTWYGVGILFVTGLGALAGRRLLRW